MAAICGGSYITLYNRSQDREWQLTPPSSRILELLDMHRKPLLFNSKAKEGGNSCSFCLTKGQGESGNAKAPALLHLFPWRRENTGADHFWSPKTASTHGSGSSTLQPFATSIPQWARARATPPVFEGPTFGPTFVAMLIFLHGLVRYPHLDIRIFK